MNLTLLFSEVCIQYKEITKVTMETSSAAEIAAGSRPFRRIAIYAHPPCTSGKFIDVSFNHFAAEDIRKLIRRIRDLRPDLSLPKS